MTGSSWLTIKDVCARLRIDRATWHRWEGNEAIRTPDRIQGLGRMVRYSESDFEHFLKSFGGLAGGPDKHQDDKAA